MTLQEIEKLRKLYSKTKKLWMDNDELMKYPSPLSELSDIIDAAVLDMYNAAVDAENIAHSKSKTVIVELPIDVAKYHANLQFFTAQQIESGRVVLSHACQKALEQLTWEQLK